MGYTPPGLSKRKQRRNEMKALRPLSTLALVAPLATLAAYAYAYLAPLLG